MKDELNLTTNCGKLPNQEKVTNQAGELDKPEIASPDLIKEKLLKEIKQELDKGITRNKVLPLDWAMDRIEPILINAIEETSKVYEKEIRKNERKIKSLNKRIDYLEGKEFYEGIKKDILKAKDEEFINILDKLRTSNNSRILYNLDGKETDVMVSTKEIKQKLEKKE